MPCKYVDLLSALCIPELKGLILACRDNTSAVRTECTGIHLISMPYMCGDLFSALGIPELEGLIEACRDNVFTIWTECIVNYTISVPSKSGDLWAILFFVFLLFDINFFPSYKSSLMP